MHSSNTFSAQTNHGHTRTHKIHHGPNLEETTTFYLIVLFMINHKGYIQMSFFHQDPQVGNPKIIKIGIPMILEAHNFLCRLYIEVRF